MKVGREITKLKSLIDFGNNRVLFKYGKKASHCEKNCAVNKLLSGNFNCRNCYLYNTFALCVMAEYLEYLK